MVGTDSISTKERNMSTTDTLLSSSYGDPLLRVPGLGPYQRLPERSSWTEWEVRQRPDGSTYRRERSCARWAGSFSTGPWAVVP